jgi:hypothetical protein
MSNALLPTETLRETLCAKDIQNLYGYKDVKSGRRTINRARALLTTKRRQANKPEPDDRHPLTVDQFVEVMPFTREQVKRAMV